MSRLRALTASVFKRAVLARAVPRIEEIAEFIRRRPLAPLLKLFLFRRRLGRWSTVRAPPGARVVVAGSQVAVKPILMVAAVKR